MAEMSSGQTQHTYRLLDRDGNVLEEKRLPTDGEAVAWAEDLRDRTPGLTVRRIERLDENEHWVFVSEAGAAPADREPE
jgi:hypothetical protein